VLLTGDNEATTRSVAAAAGIDEVISGTMPDGKARVIADLETSGCSVAMVGDGVNDGPALARARLGLALGSEPGWDWRWALALTWRSARRT
jgi:P-type E1-E2 ATPase